jgi:biotin carboxyl carrier protein
VKLKVTVDGKQYEVDVDVAEPEQPHPIYIPAVAQPRSPAAQPRATAPTAAAPEAVADESKVCRSPITGVVVRVAAQVGQQIQANDVLMVLEAMKMETAITSPIAGKIAKLNAKVGDPVQGGQVLVEFE